ncbi:MAG: EAL domain-containing protein [Steroidobacteraceae bacterium]
MSDSTAVPVLAHSTVRDPIEGLNSLLRRAGLAVHCTWIPGMQDIADGLEQLNPELLISFEPAGATLGELAHVRDQVAHTVPLIVIREQLDEAQIAADIAAGARDSVSLGQPGRVQAVIQRELRAFRMERTLVATLRSAQEYRHQIESVLQRSNDAIAQVQEGILVDVNSAWLELFGYGEAGALNGHPLMDLFEPDSQAALRGALAACLQGRWNDHTLRVTALTQAREPLNLELVLALGELDNEPCVRLIVPARRRDDNQLASELANAVKRDAATGLLRRRALIEEIQTRLQTPMRGGVRYMAVVRPDRFIKLEAELGMLKAEDFLTALANLVAAQLGPNDLAGHFGGTSLLLLLERGNKRDVEAWSEQLVERVGKHEFENDGKTIRGTCTIGLGAVPHARPESDAAINDALTATRRGRERGGNQVITIDQADTDTRVLAYDQVWVKHIRAALLENRFRLVQQPVASLRSEKQAIFDVAIRMLDAAGKEILPSEFLPAAERNDLMKSIDRWVIGASMSFAARNNPDLLFVRLSRHSAMDTSTLLPWLDNQIKGRQFDPTRLCLTVTAQFAAQSLDATLQLGAGLRTRGLKFALEHFGTAESELELLQKVPTDFVRIDGALMQGLAGNESAQERVRAIVEQAAQRSMQTVAERIEDANTMAVVWQLGVQYIQGYLVHAPEEVVLKS